MKLKYKFYLVLILIPVSELTSLYLMFHYNVKNFPDPLNVITILFLAFAPLMAIIYYLITRIYFSMRDGKSCQ